MNSDFRLAVGYLRHPKTKMLRRKLGDAAVLSHIQLLEFTALQRPDGVLSGLDAEEIAIAADWDGDADAFLEALVQRGLLDVRDDGVFCVHDWMEHNPWAAGAGERSSKAKKAADARWSKPQDAPDAQGDAPECPEHDALKCSEHDLALPRVSVEECPSPILSSPLLSSPSQGEELLPESVTTTPVPAARISSLMERFKTFYEAYPLKRNRGNAEKAWQKIAPTQEDLALMLAALAWQKNSPQWERDGGAYIPHPATYLYAKGWMDEPAPQASARASPPGLSESARRSEERLNRRLAAGHDTP